jgi:O-antigen ligase
MYRNPAKKKINTYLISLLFALIPASYIAGNLVININILLFIIVNITIYKNNIFKLNKNFLDKLVMIFFSYVIFVGLFNQFYNYYFENVKEDISILLKTIAYCRFLILYFILRFLIDKDLLNFKFFFISCSLCVLFVCFDLIFQLYFGKDIFGLEPAVRRMTGPFGDEAIAGSYLQRFSFFLFFLLPAFLNIENKKIFNLLLATSVILILFSIIIAGNRMPFLLFLLIMMMIFVFEKSVKKYLISFFITFLIIFTISYNFNLKVKNHIQNLVSSVSLIANSAFTTDIDRKDPLWHTHYHQFYNGYKTWQQNLYFGGGIRSFKLNCSKEMKNCGSHPHNYYLEVLSDLGIFGMLLLYFIFIRTLYDAFVVKYFSKNKFSHNLILTPFMFLLIAEVFPVKTSGSFFTTGNATFIILVMTITIALSQKKN